MVLVAAGGEFKLTNGDILKGEGANFTDDGLAVRLAVGGFSPTVPWGRISQETLKELLQNPQAKPFVEPYIEIPPEERRRDKPAKKEIIVRDPPRVTLASGKPSILAAFGTPIGMFIAGILYIANLFIAVEVARFRSRPPGLVAAVSALFPFFGPALFAVLPAASAHSPDAAPETAPQEAAAAPAAAPKGSAGGLSVAGHAAPAQAGGSAAYAQVYNRSNTTFDRRFFETKFTGFFRMVPSDAEKDMVLVVKAAKAEYVARRISRISSNEMHLQLQRGNTEVSVSYGEIVEVSVRHKDAK